MIETAAMHAIEQWRAEAEINRQAWLKSQAINAELFKELLLAADTFRDFSAVLRTIGKDVMAAAADIAERHIRDRLAEREAA